MQQPEVQPLLSLYVRATVSPDQHNCQPVLRHHNWQACVQTLQWDVHPWHHSSRNQGRDGEKGPRVPSATNGCHPLILYEPSGNPPIPPLFRTPWNSMQGQVGRRSLIADDKSLRPCQPLNHKNTVPKTHFQHPNLKGESNPQLIWDCRDSTAGKVHLSCLC